MIALTALDYLKYMGVGLVLIPFFLVSKALMIKTKNEFKNYGFGFASIFLEINITFILAPVGILLAIYLDKGMNALLIVFLVLSLALLGSYFYDKIIKRIFIIRIDEETFYALYHRAKNEGISVKALIAGRIRRG